MHIHEAITESAGGRIRRQSWPEPWEMQPTNTPDCCVVFGPYTPQGTRCWNPMAEDLIADDWEVVAPVGQAPDRS